LVVVRGLFPPGGVGTSNRIFASYLMSRTSDCFGKGPVGLRVMRWATALIPSCLSEITNFTLRNPRRLSERRRLVQNGSASEGLIAIPSTSRTPSVFTATAIILLRRRTRTLRPHGLQVLRIDPQGTTCLLRTDGWGRRSRAHRYLDLADPAPAGRLDSFTRSSTERVETPWICFLNHGSESFRHRCAYSDRVSVLESRLSDLVGTLG
jgi:hypothetical protein